MRFGGAKDVERLTAILKTLNTHAKIVPISHGQVQIDEVLNTGLFDFARAQQAPGWLKEMRGEHVPETEEYGIEASPTKHVDPSIQKNSITSFTTPNNMAS